MEIVAAIIGAFAVITAPIILHYFKKRSESNDSGSCAGDGSRKSGGAPVVVASVKRTKDTKQERPQSERPHQNTVEPSRSAPVSQVKSVSPHREGEYSGLIGFRDGTNAGFTFMRSGWTGDKFQYSTELLDLKGFSTDRRSIILDSVARIDFLEMTAAENREVAADHDLREVRKCNVSFRDGGKRDRIFISVRGMTWRGSRESGQVADASIRRIVFSEK